VVKEEKQFKYSVSPIRYGDLLHIWNYAKKKDFSSEKGLRRLLGKRQHFAGLFGKEKLLVPF
jgi:hypothetical protein